MKISQNFVAFSEYMNFKANTSKAFRASGAIINCVFRQKPVRPKWKPQGSLGQIVVR